MSVTKFNLLFHNFDKNRILGPVIVYKLQNSECHREM